LYLSCFVSPQLYFLVLSLAIIACANGRPAEDLNVEENSDADLASAEKNPAKRGLPNFAHGFGHGLGHGYGPAGEHFGAAYPGGFRKEIITEAVEVPKHFSAGIKWHAPVETVVKEVPVPNPFPVEVKVPVDRPYPVEVPVRVDHPYPVEVPVAVPQPRPYPVKVPVPVRDPYPVEVKVPVDHPYPVLVDRPFPVYERVPVEVPVPVERPYPVEVRVPVPNPIPVEVPVDRPYPVYVEKKIPVREPYPVEVPVQVPVYVPVEVPVEVKVPVNRPYPVEVKVPVPEPYPVEVPVAVEAYPVDTLKTFGNIPFPLGNQIPFAVPEAYKGLTDCLYPGQILSGPHPGYLPFKNDLPVQHFGRYEKKY
jgi:hypothetical protein